MKQYIIKQIHLDDYESVRELDRDAFAFSERDSDSDFHEVFADNIRCSSYYIPELDLVAITEEGIHLGHAIFSELPMGGDSGLIVWLGSLAVKQGEADKRAERACEYQREGIGMALVMRGLDLDCLSDANTTKREYEKWCSEKDVFAFLHSEQCPFPKHICQMFFTLEQNSKTIIANIEKLPIVLAHKDCWVENIIYADGEIKLIDWDTAGWGYLGEDIASLIIDETYTWCIEEYYKRLVPAYYKGFSEYVELSLINGNCIRDMILIKFGYRLVRGYQYAKTSEHKEQHVIALQKIYEMGDV